MVVLPGETLNHLDQVSALGVGHGLDGVGASDRTRLVLNLAASGQPVAESKSSNW
jgi:hypothetical protein